MTIYFEVSTFSLLNINYFLIIPIIYSAYKYKMIDTIISRTNF